MQESKNPNSEETEEERLQVLRDVIVGFLIQVKKQYLAKKEVNKLKALGQIQTRLMVATNTTETVQQWMSSVCQSLRLTPPNNALSASMIELSEIVYNESMNDDFSFLVQEEIPLLIAMMQDELEKAREKKEAKHGNNTI